MDTMVAEEFLTALRRRHHSIRQNSSMLPADAEHTRPGSTHSGVRVLRSSKGVGSFEDPSSVEDVAFSRVVNRLFLCLVDADPMLTGTERPVCDTAHRICNKFLYCHSRQLRWHTHRQGMPVQVAGPWERSVGGVVCHVQSG